jgi:hypothetical protein
LLVSVQGLGDESLFPVSHIKECQQGFNYVMYGKVIDIPNEFSHCLEEYFIQNPDFAKYLYIRLSGRKPDPKELDIAFSEKIIVSMDPAGQ